MSPLPTVLYVEDDAYSRDIMRTILSVNGYTNVVFFEDSEAFETRLHNLFVLPDVIFLDIHVKPMSGFEMLNILRQLPNYAHKPVIALTASVMNEEVQTLQLSGFDGAIGKPLDYDVFPVLLKQILDGQSVWYVS